MDSLLHSFESREGVQARERSVNGDFIEDYILLRLPDDHVLRKDGAEVLHRGVFQGGGPGTQGRHNLVLDEVRDIPTVAEARGRFRSLLPEDGPHVLGGPSREREALLADHHAADVHQLVRRVILEVENVREAALDAFVALHKAFHRRGVPGEDDHHVLVVLPELGQQGVHHDAAEVLLMPLHQLVSLVDKEDVPPGPGQQRPHLLLRLADPLPHEHALLRPDDMSAGEDAPGGEDLADDLRDGGLAGARVAEEGHMEPRHVGREPPLHAAVREEDGVQVVPHLGLDLPEADQGVQLLHRLRRRVAYCRNVLRLNRPELLRGGGLERSHPPVHRRDDLVIEKVLHQPGVLEAGSPEVVLVQDQHPELLPGGLGEFDLLLGAFPVEQAEEVIRTKVLQVDGRGEMLLQERVFGRQDVLHPLRVTHQHQHPVIVGLLVGEGLGQGPGNLGFGVEARPLVLPVEVVGVLQDEGPALGFPDGGAGSLALAADARGGQVGVADDVHLVRFQQPQFLVQGGHQARGRALPASGVPENRRMKSGRILLKPSLVSTVVHLAADVHLPHTGLEGVPALHRFDFPEDRLGIGMLLFHFRRPSVNGDAVVPGPGVVAVETHDKFGRLFALQQAFLVKEVHQLEGRDMEAVSVPEEPDGIPVETGVHLLLALVRGGDDAELALFVDVGKFQVDVDIQRLREMEFPDEP